MTEAIYIIFLLLFLFVFMYQRTTLTIARILQAPSINEVQLVLTPTWIGMLGWVSWGVYVASILIGIKYGVIVGIASAIVIHIISAVIPIPSGYFFNLIEKHLKREFIIKTSNYEHKKAEAIEELLKIVRKIRLQHKVD